MRGLTDEERDAIINAVRDASANCASLRSREYSPGELRAVENLVARGCLVPVACANHAPENVYHPEPTPLGRLALQLDAAARGMEVGR